MGQVNGLERDAPYQQEAVVTIAPALAAHLELHGLDRYESENFRGTWGNNELKFWRNNSPEDEPFLVAERDKLGNWHDQGSTFDRQTRTFFEQDVLPKLEEHRRHLEQ